MLIHLYVSTQGAQVDVMKINEQNQKVNMQMKLSWEQEKYDYVKRIEELESDLRQAHKEFNWKLRSLKQVCTCTKEMLMSFL